MLSINSSGQNPKNMKCKYFNMNICYLINLLIKFEEFDLYDCNQTV